MAKLTADRLKQVLDYDPVTGVFRWRVALSDRTRVGSAAGCVRNDNGYRIIRIDGVIHLEHRLAWLYVHGTWPADHIDHRNCKKDDNRIENLRECTRQQNSINAPLQRRNSTGFKGVRRWKNYWGARITVNRKEVRLGLFGTPEEAGAAYMKAASELFGEFARSR